MYRWPYCSATAYQWLNILGLKDSAEALIMAAQEQGLDTISVEARSRKDLTQGREGESRTLIALSLSLQSLLCVGFNVV